MAFEVVVADVEELDSGAPEEVALANARAKASAVASASAGRVILGVDTVVSLGGRLFGKPAGEDEARSMLGALAGEVHEVWSGAALVSDGGVRTVSACTAVAFRGLSGPQLDAYVETGEWRERAGGYAIQGRGAALVREIRGDYLNVVGLPAAALIEAAPELFLPTR